MRLEDFDNDDRIIQDRLKQKNWNEIRRMIVGDF
jgi:hypothetical protein